MTYLSAMYDAFIDINSEGWDTNAGASTSFLLYTSVFSLKPDLGEAPANETSADNQHVFARLGFGEVYRISQNALRIPFSTALVASSAKFPLFRCLLYKRLKAWHSSHTLRAPRFRPYDITISTYGNGLDPTVIAFINTSVFQSDGQKVADIFRLTCLTLYEQNEMGDGLDTGE
ncbi:hypothetical protein VNI00_015014 [Paramarasmius palmivorus]|uniref:Uncharacterized protein n=1 Tax=Paramarasmius palmivorus TaxID=297713 RepID=A0AAW0BNR6_9AGAR